MALPPVEPLYEHLCALRDAQDPTDPQHQRRWREVARWLELAFPGTRSELADARQETMLSLLRNVTHMRAEGPLQAAKWVATILRRKRVDALRTRIKDPVDRALSHEPRREGSLSLLDRLEAEDGAALTPQMLQNVIATVLEHVHRALEESEPSAAKRQLWRTQAQATLLRLVCDADAEAIESALGYGEPIERDRLYKWIERGRRIVELGLGRWERLCDDEEEKAEVAPVIAILRELIEERRADAGLPRLERRKEQAEEGT